MKEESQNSIIKRLVCQIAPNAKYEEDVLMSDSGLNSLEMLQLVVAVEGEFGIEFEDTMLAKLVQLKYSEFILYINKLLENGQR